MARGWPFGLVALVACFPRQATSFFGHLSLPRAVSRPTARTSTATTTTVVAAAPTPGDGAPVDARTAPPSYIARNNVSLAGDFVSSREGEPTADELADENLMRMLAQKGSDEEVNWIVWKCLGYRYDSDEDAWKAVKVFPRWQEKYPEPVDFVGVTRIYQPEVDKPVFRALQDITKAIPFEYKRLIVEKLKPLGFTGFLLDELTPNRTRRAQLTNFLIYYREHLWGVPIEEVERRRVARKAARAREPMSDMLEG